MKRISLLAIVLFAFLSSSYAQYNIRFEVKNSTDDTVILGQYYMGGTFALDTSINKSGKFSFSNKKETLKQGIYFFSNKKGKFCEFIVTDSQNMTFKTTDEDWVNNLIVKGSKDEQIYLDYIKKSNKHTAIFQSLSKEASSKEEYDRKLNDLKIESDSLKEDFMNKYPQHFLTKVLKSSLAIKLPEFEKIYKEDGVVDSSAMQKIQWNYVKRHYFDNIDLTCEGLLRTPKGVFSRFYEAYWNDVMKYEKVDTIIYYADSLINECKDNKEMEKYFINDITRRYLLDNVMGHDAVYVHMVDKYFKTGRVTWFHPSDLDMNIERANKWKNILIGKYVPDLACPETDDNSTWHSLSSMNNKYKILIFWSVECGHCTVEMPKIAEWYKDNKDIYNVGIYAVHTEGDISDMQTFIKKYNMNWINVNGLYANYDWHEYFDIEKTPVIYILDKNNKILAKNVAAEKIGDLLRVIEKGEFNL
ncbi:MAG: redoxin domain-containing protein [Bacteroidales bacterium]|nr:redoxin domain-containing protein [Bacteroidales bacterium]